MTQSKAAMAVVATIISFCRSRSIIGKCLAAAGGLRRNAPGATSPRRRPSAAAAPILDEVKLPSTTREVGRRLRGPLKKLQVARVLRGFRLASSRTRWMSRQRLGAARFNGYKKARSNSITSGHDGLRHRRH
jgi:hypothetical protein